MSSHDLLGAVIFWLETLYSKCPQVQRYRPSSPLMTWFRRSSLLLFPQPKQSSTTSFPESRWCSLRILLLPTMLPLLLRFPCHCPRQAKMRSPTALPPPSDCDCDRSSLGPVIYLSLRCCCFCFSSLFFLVVLFNDFAPPLTCLAFSYQSTPTPKPRLQLPLVVNVGALFSFSLPTSRCSSAR